jgi:hypothetical protein
MQAETDISVPPREMDRMDFFSGGRDRINLPMGYEVMMFEFIPLRKTF